MNTEADSGSSSTSLPGIALAREWSTPQLVRLGAIADVTAVVDNIGRNDGGKFPKRRT